MNDQGGDLLLTSGRAFTRSCDFQFPILARSLHDRQQRLNDPLPGCGMLRQVPEDTMKSADVQLRLIHEQ